MRPKGAGEFFGLRWGVWNGTGFLGSATQEIDLKDLNGRPYEFSAWLASRDDPSDTDYARVMLEFFDGAGASGQSLGSVLFDGNNQSSPFIVGSLNLGGEADPLILPTQDNWTRYAVRGVVPALAQSASVVIQGASISGPTAEGGYADLVSLQVVPEPTSVLLITTCVLLLVVWRCASAGRKGRSMFPRA